LDITRGLWVVISFALVESYVFLLFRGADLECLPYQILFWISPLVIYRLKDGQTRDLGSGPFGSAEMKPYEAESKAAGWHHSQHSQAA